MTGLFLEIVVSILLIATCGYCYILDRRLRALRESQAEMLRVIQNFDEASRRAERTLQAMQQHGLNAGRDLETVAAKAQSLITELSVMVNAGDHIAGRIEGAVKQVRSIGRAANDRRNAS